MFSKIKLRFAALGLVAILVTLISQGSLAYYTTYGKTTNVVTSGSIQLLIHETTAFGDPYPDGGMFVLPGDVVGKVVTVENDCAHPFYLRVKAVCTSDSEELPAEECVALNINTEHWKYKDGWYYYYTVLEPSEITPWFFSRVEFVGSAITTDHIGTKVEITVVAQAVQSENNPIQDGDTSTALGWPAEQGGEAE